MGCARLTNYLVRPEGPAFVRPGMFLADITPLGTGDSAGGRLIPFVFNAQQRYVIWLGHLTAKVFRTSDNFMIQALATPFTLAQAAEVDFVQVADTLLLAHRAHPLHQIQRQIDGSFQSTAYAFVSPPQIRAQAPVIRLSASGTTGTVTMTCPDGPAFRPGYDAILNPSTPKADIGSVWRFRGTPFTITAVADDGLTATATVTGAFSDAAASDDWTEQAGQAYLGYYHAIAYYQDRLWLGGTDHNPCDLWASRTGAPYDFEVGTDPEDGIQITASAGRIEPVQHLVPGTRGLEVYTTGDEALIRGDADAPVTPGTVSYVPQSRFGSRQAKPVRLEARTIFAQRDGGVVREAAYSEEEQSFRQLPLSTRASHLVADPVRLNAAPGFLRYPFDLLMVLNRNGVGAAMTSDRSQEVSAWSEIVSRRFMVDWASVGDRVYVLTKAGSSCWLEFFDPDAIFDSQQSGTNNPASVTITGAAHLASTEVEVFADGYWLGLHQVSAEGVITLDEPVTNWAYGLPIDVALQPMPVQSENGDLLGRVVRPFRAEVRFLRSAGMTINGQPVYDRPFDDAIETPPTPTTDVRRVHLCGTSRGAECPLVIGRDGPFPQEVLAIAIDYRLGA